MIQLPKRFATRLPKRTLIIDVSNILFRVSAVQKHSPYSKDCTPEELVGLCMHISLQSIFKWYNKFHPEFVVFAFEGGGNWRKNYTATAKSRLQYKGQRVIDPEMKHFYTLIDSFKNTMTNHTSVCCLSVNMMEADDCIAAFCQLYADPTHEINIVSGDKDFTQLLKLPNVKLINPDTGKARNQPGDKDYEEDIDYWLFKKFIRGDGGDNVPSAFPRVRETRIKKAYEHEYDRLNFMNEHWTQSVFEPDENGVEVEKKIVHRVGDLYEENIILMDLYRQPDDIRVALLEGVAEQTDNCGTYSHFHFLRFLEDHGLQRVREDAMKFIDMFANNQRFFKGEAVNRQAVKPASVNTETVNNEVVKKTSLLSF